MVLNNIDDSRIAAALPATESNPMVQHTEALKQYCFHCPIDAQPLAQMHRSRLISAKGGGGMKPRSRLTATPVNNLPGTRSLAGTMLELRM
jgi:hypothetical protein